MRISVDKLISLLCIVTYITFVQGKGGGGGGGGGRGGGGGGRGSGRGSSGKGLTKTRTAVILGSGAAGYAAYRAHQNSKKDRQRGEKDKDTPDIDSFEQYADPDSSDYKLLESSGSYYASEGIGMSAWALIFIILGIIALGTIGWYCCNVFLPVWEDNRQMRRRSMLGRTKDEVPLQETPSTATPSP